MSDLTVSQQLFRAADLLEERDWVQGEGWDGEPLTGGCLCLEGAIQAACGIPYGETTSADVNHCPAGRAVRRYLLGDEASNEERLYEWNDQEFRSKDEVIALLRNVAELELIKENHFNE